MNYILFLYLLTVSANAFQFGYKTIEKKSDNNKVSHSTKAVAIPLDELRYHETYQFINNEIDTIGNIDSLVTFYQKLYELKLGKREKVSIVQIGDSHIQPDIISKEVRIGLQRFFGDAGRGLVFPYQLARTNGPQDIKSSTNTRWTASKITQLHYTAPRGISGFSLSRHNGLGNFQLHLKSNTESGDQSFDYVKLFVGDGAWRLNPVEASDISYTIVASDSTSFYTQEILLSEPANGFDIHALANNATFFGASLEKHNTPGVLFHTIGVNGARYAQYNESEMFWKQLPALHADLYILSMGTNESFYNTMTEDFYIHDVAETIAKIKTIDPEASILVTTMAESFKNGKRNAMMERLNLALKYYCNRLSIPLWDLFEITGGSGSSSFWLKNNLLQSDKIHYQRKAYAMQGALLFDALAEGYNRFITADHYPMPQLTKIGDK